MSEKSIEELIRELEGPDADVRVYAALELGSVNKKGKDISPAIPALIRALGTFNRDFEIVVANVLGRAASIKNSREATFVGLMKALANKDPNVKARAYGILEYNMAGWYGLDISAALPELIKALADEAPIIRERAVSILERAALDEKNNPATIAALVNAIENGDSQDRRNAAYALKKVANSKADVSAAIPALIRALGDSDPEVRGYSALSLGNASRNGADVYASIPALVKALGDTDSSVRRHAGWALEFVEPRDHSDLKMIAAAAREAKKEKKELVRFTQVYSEWSRKLNNKAEQLVADKKFHVPEIKPDKVDRVLRVRRSCA